ncbi:MAG: hypothetical protein ACRBCI_15630 [Cellvibrionaceae bacterium]
MTTKLKIDISIGILEVEGTEAFVKVIYDDFKDQLGKTERANPVDPIKQPIGKDSTPNKTPKSKKAKMTTTATQKGKAKKAPQLLKNLDLSGGTGKPSLKEFYLSYAHKTNYERNLIFVYYLKQKLNTDKVTLDHIFTCYRHVGQKLPKALEQGMRDTASEKGWVDIDNLDDIQVPVAGINHIEHDLEKAGDE